MTRLPRKPTSCWKPHYAKTPVAERYPDQQSIRERAEFLAREIQGDVMAGEREIADAIEAEIRRFAPPRFQQYAGA